MLSLTGHATVEYFDPHGVYPLVAPGLIPRLPLRNLHWQSHAGPLRSIDTLHIELATQGSVDPRTDQSTDSFPTPDNNAAARENTDGFQTQVGGGGGGAENTNQTAAHKGSTPARRHQIPGLRRTPYLKVLLVRCDDNDSYKSSVRQEIRDWVKTQTPGSGSAKKTNTAENHDAFEWLILHVVVPNTAAAAQPRVTGKSEAADRSSTMSSRWRPGSSTILEKLRSDFSPTGKGAADRIAQIRIGVNDVPYDILPRVTNAVPSTYKETAEETEAAWHDLISKMRDRILASFDLRVTQYEEDIKEKDTQRSLPGWNFCTFFILKEGLARGFESVGLVEDALVGYDELSVGLDMILKDQASGESGAAANALLNYSEDLKQTAAAAVTAVRGTEDGDDEEVVDMQASEAGPGDAGAHFDDIPISSSKKPYRDLILENKVSVFDFRCYIFSRQVSLLQRLGNAYSTREELLAKLKEQQEAIILGVAPRAPPPKQTENEQEDLSMLAEICRRTLEFIPAVSQVMRSDLQEALAYERKPSDNEPNPVALDLAALEVIDNLVASFVFSVAQQILAQTSTKALPIPPTTLGAPDGHEQKTAIPEPKTMMHPARTSSLRVTTGNTGVRPPPSPNVFPGPGQGAAAAEYQAQKKSISLKAGLEDLAAKRAELYALSRNVLEQSGKKRGWSDGWASVPVVGQSSMVDMVEISLGEDAVPKAAPAEGPMVSISGITNQLLRAALDNNGDFYRLYESLTDKALRHYTVANNTRSVQACMADLAVLKYYVRDYGSASSYFWRTTPFYGESGWSLLELSMLVMYSRCLKELQRKDEFVKVMLKLLTKASRAERERQTQMTNFRFGKKETVDYPDGDAIKGFVGELLSETKGLSEEIRLPLSSFFSGVEVDGAPEYHRGRDSFSLHLKLTSLLVDSFTADMVRARIVGQISGTQREVWLELSSPAVIKPGKNRLKLDSNVSCTRVLARFPLLTRLQVVIPGTYELDKVELTFSKIYLYHERDISQQSNKSADLLRAPRITIYHRSDTLDVQLTASNHIQLDKNNTVDIDINSGWNDLVDAEVRIKAATGGLRLITAEAECVNESLDFSNPPEAGLFSFGRIPPQTNVKIRFPYTVETEVLHVTIRIEVSYKTEHGTFMFSRTPSVPISLALGVNVQDLFKHKTLLSRFTVSTASPSPLRLFKSELIGSEIFDAQFGLPPGNPVLVFPRQPASLLYKIRRKKGSKATAKTRRTMYLKLHYSVVQSEIVEAFDTAITSALQDTPLHMYSRLLVDSLATHIQKDLSIIELERAALLGSVSTTFLSHINWTPHLGGLGKSAEGKDLCAALASFVVSWQSQHENLELPLVVPSEPKSIVIPVDIPSIGIVHTANICLAKPTAAENPYPEALTMNQLVPATLQLKWTRIWDSATSPQDMADLEFSYEVTAPNDTWLIGGRRKGHFVIPAPSSDLGSELSSTVETEAEIPLLLIPQRDGWLSYPNVDIREVRGGGLASLGGSAGGSGGVTPVEPDLLQHCETDLRNLGETIRVVADRSQVTLSLDASGPGGGPLVLGVEGRGRGERVVA